jgi:hypothetical protein
MNQTVKAPPQDVPQADPPGNGTPAPLETDPLERLATELSKIQLEMLELEAAEFAKLNTLHHTQTESARNLIHHSNNYQTCYWKCCAARVLPLMIFCSEWRTISARNDRCSDS